MSAEDRKKYICYTYTPEQVKEHEDYFRACFKSDLSGYKALLFFCDYLRMDEYGRKETRMDLEQGFREDFR